jgi:endonuclease/exonuclease/phosphatase family metal-dependent hydrolase
MPHNNRSPELPATPHLTTGALARLPATLLERGLATGMRSAGTLANFRLNRRSEPQCESVQALINPRGIPVNDLESDELRLLSFNIQVGISTARYRQYLTNGWKHLLPHEARADNLRSIGDLVADYDVVALQEVDTGSLRSGFVNQVEYLAYRGNFPYWYAQLNRDLGPIAQHGNGLLSRLQPSELEDHKLPGTFAGRGAIVSRFRFGGADVLVVLLHLSLGERSRHQQLSYVRSLIKDEAHVVVMGDMNSHLSGLLFDSPLADTSLLPAADSKPTYPSWRPALTLDHVLVTPALTIRSCDVLDCNLSDHRPVAVRIAVNQPEHAERLLQ